MLIRDVIQRKSRLVKTTWINLVERATLAHAAGLHVTAELEGDEFRALCLPMPEIVRSIPNGIDWPERHLPLSETPFALPPRYALFLSRISWKKGLERLLTAWHDVQDLPLVLAGNDDEDYTPKLRRLVRSLGLESRVVFTGPVSDEHKWALYKKAELFLLPSYSENFGMVVGEAMAMGCPVVVTPEVGVARIVASEGAGIVTSNDPEKLAAAINALLADEPRRRELARGVETAKNISPGAPWSRRWSPSTRLRSVHVQAQVRTQWSGRERPQTQHRRACRPGGAHAAPGPRAEVFLDYPSARLAAKYRDHGFWFWRLHTQPPRYRRV